MCVEKLANMIVLYWIEKECSVPRNKFRTVDGLNSEALPHSLLVGDLLIQRLGNEWL